MRRQGADMLPAFINHPRGDTVMPYLEGDQKMTLAHPSYPLIKYGGLDPRD